MQKHSHQAHKPDQHFAASLSFQSHMFAHCLAAPGNEHHASPGMKQATLICGVWALQAAEAKHAAGVESLKDGWVGELKKQKEAWTAAEKGRRDTWLADKTKQVKELTVKVRLLEPNAVKETGALHSLSVLIKLSPERLTVSLCTIQASALCRQYACSRWLSTADYSVQPILRNS